MSEPCKSVCARFKEIASVNGSARVHAVVGSGIVDAADLQTSLDVFTAEVRNGCLHRAVCHKIQLDNHSVAVGLGDLSIAYRHHVALFVFVGYRFRLADVRTVVNIERCFVDLNGFNTRSVFKVSVACCICPRKRARFGVNARQNSVACADIFRRVLPQSGHRLGKRRARIVVQIHEFGLCVFIIVCAVDLTDNLVGIRSKFACAVCNFVNLKRLFDRVVIHGEIRRVVKTRNVRSITRTARTFHIFVVKSISG